MTDETAVAPATPPPPPPAAVPVTAKTRIGDVVFGAKSAVVIFIGGLILGGLGGAAITVLSQDDGPRLHHRQFPYPQPYPVPCYGPATDVMPGMGCGPYMEGGSGSGGVVIPPSAPVSPGTPKGR